jgi:hypothetical protein
MRFKDFLKLDEEQSGSDKGMMGFGAKETQGRVPSDGQPFADKLKSTAGARPSQGGMGGEGMNPMAAGGMFMKKKMKKKMKKS